MYPNEVFLGMGFYEIFILIGIVLCFVSFRILADKKNFSARLQNFVLACAFFAIVVGYLASVFTQAIYNAIESGTFEITEGTGATFLGGLIGGAAAFLAAYFGFGHFVFKNNKENVMQFKSFSSMAGASIAIAHAFGRVGCFFAGCCYGIETKLPIGVKMAGESIKRLPVQLFETAFLLVLFAFIFILILKKDDFIYGLPSYMIAYGIWRYFAEFMRGDDRGEFFIKIFTPSQGTSILLIIGGIALLIILKRHEKN